jgi:hypothetical protein
MTVNLAIRFAVGTIVSERHVSFIFSVPDFHRSTDRMWHQLPSWYWMPLYSGSFRI